MALRKPVQLALPVPRARGGRRPGAGRKPKGPRAGVSHLVRPYHDAAHPAHVTLRICHFSVQGNHVHLLVESKGREALSRGVQGLAIRLARAVNRALSRRGRVWADRYHARALTSPRQARNALVYVLHNVRKHQPAFRGLDPCSSAAWFDGWQNRPAMSLVGVTPPIADARTWLLRVGWRRGGSIGVDDSPRSSG